MSVWRHLGMAPAVGLWTLALVIGNSAYHDAPLRNPVNDVRAMTRRLKELGFTVLAYENATKRTDDVRPCSLTFVK